MTTLKKMLISFTAGAVLGMLYAPHKGSKTRKKLANVGRDVKEGWNNIADGISDRIDSIREGVDKFSDTAIEKVEVTRFETNDKAGFL
jgi:gas vesicle protein